MSYRADKQVIDTHTHMDRHTDTGDDNIDTRRPKLASGNKMDPTKIVGTTEWTRDVGRMDGWADRQMDGVKPIYPGSPG